MMMVNYRKKGKDGWVAMPELIGSVYRHYKNRKEYTITGFCWNADTDCWNVCYQDPSHRWFSSSLEKFFGYGIKNDVYFNRFTFVSGPAETECITFSMPLALSQGSETF